MLGEAVRDGDAAQERQEVRDAVNFNGCACVCAAALLRLHLDGLGLCCVLAWAVLV